MLVLAVHSFEQVTAKVVPTSGSRSTSLWDVDEPEALLQWLNDNVNVEVTHEVFEVQEEFAIGVMGEVNRARTAEKVAAGARDLGERTASTVGKAASAVSHQATELDHKLKISERTAATVETIKESAVARNTVAFFNRVGSGVKSATNKVVESERVSGTSSRIAASFKRLSGSFSNKGRINSSQEDALPLGEDPVPHYARPPAADYEPPRQQEPTLRNPATAAAPGGSADDATSAPASPIPSIAAPRANGAAALADTMPASPPPELQQTVAFTLDDSESPAKH
ncbi:hypothetical protein N2152v2_002735 [Parachlorella kessleri]